MSEACPCGGGRTYAACCEPRISGLAPAPSPETLMRSRYSAFVKRDLDYLWRTTDPETRAAFDREANRQWAEQASFTGLEIVSSSEDGDRGTVEFKASFTLGGRARVHHELSSFRREGGQWYFRDGREPGFGV